MTYLESPRRNNDCYFYYYSTCAKGDNCTFRHEPLARGCETMCASWRDDECLSVHCNFRHMELRKNRKATPCYWKTQPRGCLKPHCSFMHQSARFTPAPKDLLENRADSGTDSADSTRGDEDEKINDKNPSKNSSVDSHVVNIEKDPMNLADFPDECLLYIFKHLDFPSIARCANLCRTFNRISSDQSLYRNKTATIDDPCSLKFLQWLRRRAPNFAGLCVYYYKVGYELCFTEWKGLMELTLVNVDLSKVSELPLNMLKVLELRYCEVNHLLLKSFCRNNRQHLRKLVLKCNDCYCTHCKCLLRRFDRNQLMCFAEVPMGELSECMNLEQLSIHAPSYTLPDMQLIAKLSQLKSLELEQDCEMSSLTTNEKLTVTQIPRHCQQLQRLSFTNLIYICDTVIMDFVKSCTRLESLEFKNISSISCLSLSCAIRSLPKLHSIAVINCNNVSLQDVGHLKQLIKTQDRKVNLYVKS